MVVTLKGLAAPQGSTVSIHIDITAPLNITPFVARQKVTRFVVMEISSQLLGGTPVLSVGDRLCWTVPVLLTSPGRGEMGKVGEISVDATTGELLVDEETTRRIADDSRSLAFPGC